MSEYKRFKRLIKSVIPRFPDGNQRSYTLDDVKSVINDLGMEIPAKVLKAIMSNDMLLDDFLNNLYHLEADIRKRVVNDFSVIDPKFEPKVYNEDGMLGFTIQHKGEEIVFAEYRIKKRNADAKKRIENPDDVLSDDGNDGFDDLKHSGL